MIVQACATGQPPASACPSSAWRARTLVRCPTPAAPPVSAKPCACDALLLQAVVTFPGAGPAGCSAGDRQPGFMAAGKTRPCCPAPQYFAPSLRQRVAGELSCPSYVLRFTDRGTRAPELTTLATRRACGIAVRRYQDSVRECGCSVPAAELRPVVQADAVTTMMNPSMSRRTVWRRNYLSPGRHRSTMKRSTTAARPGVSASAYS